MWLHRSQYDDDPLIFCINLVRDSNTNTARVIEHFLNNDVPDINEMMENVITELRASNSSRRTTYVNINPTCDVNFVYKQRHTINEQHRLSFTQFRVSGHDLACETGRWNRRGRGRLPLEERLCRCGLVQTEQHVVQQCPLTTHI